MRPTQAERLMRAVAAVEAAGRVLARAGHSATGRLVLGGVSGPQTRKARHLSVPYGVPRQAPLLDADALLAGQHTVDPRILSQLRRSKTVDER